MPALLTTRASISSHVRKVNTGRQTVMSVWDRNSSRDPD